MNNKTKAINLIVPLTGGKVATISLPDGYDVDDLEENNSMAKFF
jgi:DNA primase